MGQPLYCSAANAGMWGDSGYGDGHTHYAWLSSIALLPWLSGFSPQAFPPTVSFLTFPRSISPQSTSALILGLLHIPELQLPAAAPSSRSASLSGLCMAATKDCLILIPFRLPQISCFTLSLKCFSSDSELARCGAQTPASVPPPAQGRSSLTNTPVFPPCCFVLPSFVRVYIFFSTGPVLLSALSCCSACTSVSVGVFLMYPWREMYSMSTYSSAILFSLFIYFWVVNFKDI